jgi:hypothetical protein
MEAGVAVTATRYNGTIHDFVLLNAIRDLAATQAALKQASEAIRDALKPLTHLDLLSRRSFCLCCLGPATFAATGGWLTPSQVFAEARNLVDLIRSEAARALIKVHRLRGNVSVLEGSGGNVAVLTGRRCRAVRVRPARAWRQAPAPDAARALSLHNADLLAFIKER